MTPFLSENLGLSVEGLESEPDSERILGRELVDAAIAMKWMNRGVEKEAYTPVVAPVDEVARDAVFSEESNFVPAKTQVGSDTLRGDSGEIESTNEPWLSDDMVERVFG